jgi:hypothetical protein
LPVALFTQNAPLPLPFRKAKTSSNALVVAKAEMP